MSEQMEWREKTLSFVRNLNEYAEECVKKNWENIGPKPQEPERTHLAYKALEAVVKANQSGDFSELREQWPPAYSPFRPLLNENSQNIPQVCILDDGSILVRVSWGLKGKTYRLQENQVEELSSHGLFGRCPNRRFFGWARQEGIAIHDGWDGPCVALCPWPTGEEDLEAGWHIEKPAALREPSQIIPFPDGKRVLIASENGVFVLSPDQAKRLLPTNETLSELHEDDPDETLLLEVQMEHAAISPSGKWIVTGCQSSKHLIFNETLELVARIEPASAYPHFAFFSDNNTVALNSCHLNNGMTIVVKLDTIGSSKANAPIVVDDFARVFAGIAYNDSFIVGDPSGYIQATDIAGRILWHQFIGSTISSIDISPNGKTMVVSSQAGIVVIFELNAGQTAFQIGDGNHLETQRLLFWRSMPGPLRW